MSKRYDNILQTIGNTPVVKINKLIDGRVNLFVKIERFNPMSSVKDRLALGVIEAAEKAGELKPGQTVIEATSGNTGIGLAMVCAQKGYPLVIVMSESFSVERRKLMRFLGAKVVLTPAALKGKGMLDKVDELVKKNGWFFARQFENEANADIHSRTTAKEILRDFADIHLDYWITGFGTGGTLKGVARVLRKESPSTKIIVCEPDNSQLLGSGIKQERHPDGTIVESHPNFRPHIMQGWSPDFIPKLTEDAVNAKLIDRIIPIDGKKALECTKALATQEGIFVGPSAGATLAGALFIAQQAPDGSNILAMLPDTGERYLSTPLFFDVAEDMTPEELEISRSTPSSRFDVSLPAPKPQQEPKPQPLDPEAVKFLDKTIMDQKQPIAFFALQWCEFCWSARKFFNKLKIQYNSIDLDSVAYQKDNFGGKIRAALNAKTGMKTIPQIFVGGELIGGCTDLFEAYKKGTLQKRLKDLGVTFDEDVKVDPYTFLPAWMLKR